MVFKGTVSARLLTKDYLKKNDLGGSDIEVFVSDPKPSWSRLVKESTMKTYHDVSDFILSKVLNFLLPTCIY